LCRSRLRCVPRRRIFAFNPRLEREPDLAEEVLALGGGYWALHAPGYLHETDDFSLGACQDLPPWQNPTPQQAQDLERGLSAPSIRRRMAGPAGVIRFDQLVGNL